MGGAKKRGSTPADPLQWEHRTWMGRIGILIQINISTTIISNILWQQLQVYHLKWPWYNCKFNQIFQTIVAHGWSFPFWFDMERPSDLYHKELKIRLSVTVETQPKILLKMPFLSVLSQWEVGGVTPSCRRCTSPRSDAAAIPLSAWLVRRRG